MEKKAAELIGEPVLAGAILTPKGHTKQVAKSTVAGEAASALGGAAGGLLFNTVSAAGEAITEKVTGASQSPSLPGDLKEPVYLAVGANSVGFCSIKTGLLRMSPQTLLAHYPRSQVEGLAIGGGLVPEVRFRLHDGTEYLFECPRAYLGKLRQVEKLFAPR